MAPKVSYSKKVVEAYQAVSHFIISGAKGMPPQWPFSIIETNWYHAKFFPKEIFTTIKELEKKGFDDPQIAKLFWGPSAVTHWLYVAEHGLGAPEMERFKGLAVEQGVEFLEKTIDLFSLQRRGDPFCRDWKNLVLSQREVKQTVDSAKFIDLSVGNRKSAKTLSMINTILWQYCILIQVGHRSYSQEFHGPYPLKNGEVLFVRDYFNLKPTEVWEFTSSLPFNKLRIVEVYKNAKIRIDLFNHFEITPPPIKSLKRFSVQVDNERYLESVKEIQDLFENCNTMIEKGNNFVKDFAKKDWVRKVVEMRYLWLKLTKEVLGKDWRPPTEVYTLAEKIAEAEKATIEWGGRMREISAAKISDSKKEDKITQMFLDVVYQVQR